jgi:endoglucanase
MSVVKTLLLFIVGCVFAWSNGYSQTATRVYISSITPSINTGQNYSPWLNDDVTNLVGNVWTSPNMQYVDVKLKLQAKTNVSKLSLYDFEGTFTSTPARIYAANGATRTLIGTFYGYQYMAWVDINLSAPVLADSIIVRKYGNCIPEKIKIYGTPASSTITVAAIAGNSTVCAGTTMALTDATTGGTWSSSNTAAATVSSTGVVTGVAAGTTNITYSVSGAIATKAVTVSPLPSAGAVSGASSVVIGATTAFSSTVAGGTWSSSASYIASASSSGVVTGVAAGTASINYAVTNGCGTGWASKVVTVTSAPITSAGTISGTSTACVGSTTALTSSVSGGAWSSSATGVATVSTSGVVAGVAAGTATISYTVGGAVATKVVTINATPSAGTISGTASTTVGSTTALTASVAGGAWSSSATGVAAVSTSGVVTGVAAGTATVSYVVSNSCGTATATKVVTVSAAPVTSAGTIIGTATVCTGATTALTNATTGGVWSSSNAAVASVSTSGIVSGVAAGTATISYTVGTAVATKVVTVNAGPSAGSISGSSSVAAGGTIALTASVSGGAWSSSATGVAPVSSSGMVTGMAAGSAVISYAVSNSCGTAYATKSITITSSTTSGGSGTGSGGTLTYGKIPMDGKRWYQMNNCSTGLQGLHDGNLTTAVNTGSGKILTNFDAYYPVLPGEQINIDSIRFYDGAGSNETVPFKLYYIDSAWNRVLVATFIGTQYNMWVGPNAATPANKALTVPAHNVKYLMINCSSAYPNEMEVYGSYMAPTPLAPLPAKTIKFKQELGVNAFEWDFLNPSNPLVIDETRMNAIRSFGCIRHYLDWQKLEPTSGGYTFNPSHSGGWNMDTIYGRAKAEGIEMLVDIKTIPTWLQSTYPSGSVDAENVPVASGADFSDPNSYLKQAKMGFQFAARYGSNASVSSSLLSVDASIRWGGDPANVVKKGLNLVKYIESDNERDKWWKGRKAYQTGREYAANMSAFYDGHKGTMGAGVGVKNADPNMQVVMGGTALASTDYMRGMVDWCKEKRGYRADGSVNLCWDVINYHIYPNNAGSVQGGGTGGAAPEVAHADTFAANFISAAHTYAQDMPVWVTETGYDINQGSPVKAIAIGAKSVKQTQADWTLRNSLLYARMGVERTFFYMLDDVDTNSSTQFSSSGFVYPNYSRKPNADYVRQAKKLLGEYEYKETISVNPLVDRYELAGQSIYVVVKPTQNGSTMSYSLSLPFASGGAKIYTPKVGQDTMSVTTATYTGGSLTVTAGETPIFIRAAAGGIPTGKMAEETNDVLPSQSQVTVYPNPTSGVFHLDIENDMDGNIPVTVYTMGGNVCKSYTVNKSGGKATETLDISNLPNGMYFVEVGQGSNKTVKKVIKVN